MLITRELGFNKERLCAFCGKKPQKKNNEHILPQWLIEMTGSPTRNISVGVSYNSEQGSIDHRTFSINGLVVPACENCNSQAGKIEEKAAPALKSLMAGEAVSGVQIDNILDWFDKVRVGLWLLFSRLHTNPVASSANFHINQRMGTQDRCLVIQHVSDKNKGLTMRGVQTYAFMFMPSAFSLTVNDYVFTSLSTNLLVSKELGFPFADNSYYQADGKTIKCEMQRGLREVKPPLLPFDAATNGVVIAQAIIGQYVNAMPEDKQYLEEHSIKPMRSNIFIETSSVIKELGLDETTTITPPSSLSFKDWTGKSVDDIYKYQLWLLHKFLPSPDMLPPEYKAFAEKKLRFVKHLTELERGFLNGTIKPQSS